MKRKRVVACWWNRDDLNCRKKGWRYAPIRYGCV
ncbi:MAG: hypothetical protein KatS3mg022_3377 [Armatimonadota bacterium]|nr:MAG: hypothetical protein KatS3mg022_3377 [Armatimonadota bacterium]